MTILHATTTPNGKLFDPDVPHALYAKLHQIQPADALPTFYTASLRNLLTGAERTAKTAKAGELWAYRLNFPDGDVLLMYPHRMAQYPETLAKIASAA